jgi:hypothetical protein
MKLTNEEQELWIKYKEKHLNLRKVNEEKSVFMKRLFKMYTVYLREIKKAKKLAEETRKYAELNNIDISGFKE